MSVFHTPNRWCDSILRGTRIHTRRAARLYSRGSWCNTREVLAAQTLSGEPAVPGIIPGGIASCPIPGRHGSDP